MKKDFEIDFTTKETTTKETTTKETTTKEIINITLTRDKLTEQLSN